MYNDVVRHRQRVIEDFGVKYFAAYTRSRELAKLGIRHEMFPVTAVDESHWRIVWDKEEKRDGVSF